MDPAEQYQSFISWQCRLRKLAMDGRPSEGMRAGIHAVAGGDEQARINVLINRVNSSDRTSEFRHIIRKTHDSSQWVKNGLRILAELHYHETDQFVNELSALFSYDSSIAYALLKARQPTGTITCSTPRCRARCGCWRLRRGYKIFLKFS
jgi:hypothetical protein